MLTVKKLKDKKNFLIVSVLINKVSDNTHKDQMTETDLVVKCN